MSKFFISVLYIELEDLKKISKNEVVFVVK